MPDPVIDYKASIATDPLMEVSVPEMIIHLKQGIGRLIRNETDTGIISIIDRRLRDDPRYRLGCPADPQQDCGPSGRPGVL